MFAEGWLVMDKLSTASEVIVVLLLCSEDDVVWCVAMSVPGVYHCEYNRTDDIK